MTYTCVHLQTCGITTTCVHTCATMYHDSNEKQISEREDGRERERERGGGGRERERERERKKERVDETHLVAILMETLLS